MYRSWSRLCSCIRAVLILETRIMKNLILVNIFVLLFGLASNMCFGQVFLQLEQSKEVEAIKFFPGDVIEIKTKEFPKIWQKVELERFLVDEQTIITSEGIVSLHEITHFKLINSRLTIAGKGLMTFGTAWFFFGTVGSLYERRLIMSGGQFAIGGAALVVGYLFWKFASKRTLKLGVNNRLRIIDISFPTTPILGFP